MNLIINAVEAMPKGGTLTIDGAAQDSWLAIEVQDTGPGLTPDEAAKIFEPFYTTKSRRHRIGSGRELWYHPTTRRPHRSAKCAGQGTTFTVLLPLQRTPKTIDA